MVAVKLNGQSLTQNCALQRTGKYERYGCMISPPRTIIWPNKVEETQLLAVDSLYITDSYTKFVLIAEKDVPYTFIYFYTVHKSFRLPVKLSYL